MIDSDWGGNQIASSKQHLVGDLPRPGACLASNASKSLLSKQLAQVTDPLGKQHAQANGPLGKQHAQASGPFGKQFTTLNSNSQMHAWHGGWLETMGGCGEVPLLPSDDDDGPDLARVALTIQTGRWPGIQMGRWPGKVR